MLTNTIDAIRKDRAKFARDIEYLKEMARDDELDLRVERAEEAYGTETIEELEEAADMVNQLTIEDEMAMESVEIETILNAEEDLTFDEMVGIK